MNYYYIKNEVVTIVPITNTTFITDDEGLYHETTVLEIYKVVYADGYSDIISKETFENEYVLLPEELRILNDL